MQWLITGTDRVVLVANLGGLKAFICQDMVKQTQLDFCQTLCQTG